MREIDENTRHAWHGAGVAWAMVADILTGTMLWGGLGYLGDRWLGWEPWLMSIGFMVGFAVGIYAAVLHYRRMRDRAPKRT